MKDYKAKVKAVEAWERNLKYYIEQVMDDPDYASYEGESEAYGDTYVETDRMLSNYDEVLERAFELVEENIDEFKQDNVDVLAEALMPDYGQLLDDDMPDAVDDFVDELTFAELKFLLEDNPWVDIRTADKEGE